MKLEGKVAVVTGSSRGVGRSVALAFGREGANVVVNYSRSEGAAQEVVKAIEAMGQKAIAVKADVAKRDDAQALLKAAGIIYHHVGPFTAKGQGDGTSHAPAASRYYRDFSL